MGTWERKLIGVTVGVMLAPVIGGCSSDINWSDIKLLPQSDSLNQGSLSYSGQKEEFTLAPAGPGELVGPEGQCAGSESGTMVGGGVSLQMTECEIVRRVGAPERVDIGGNERGERAVVLTYIGGSRPGIYRFASGRLKSIERAPEPPPSARPQRAAPAKKRSSSS